MVDSGERAFIFNIQRYSIHDGPGIRTTVFMKGCPLKCMWCQNPESIRGTEEIGYNKRLCCRDYLCVKTCPNGAITVLKNGDIKIKRNVCSICKTKDCLSVCNTKAIEEVGRYMTVNELLKEVMKDSLFYRNSGDGGVTLSGGEPTRQWRFVLDFFKRCKEERGIHTVLDTCGYVKWERLAKILEYTDMVLYDIKHMDSKEHKRLTGIPNELILKNAKNIALLNNKKMIIRYPVIPGYNDSIGNIDSLGDFINNIGIKDICLLPYHRLGTSKYEKIGKIFRLESVLAPKEEHLKGIKDIFDRRGFNCSIQ